MGSVLYSQAVVQSSIIIWRVDIRALHWVPMPTHAHGFWVGMGAILLFMSGHRFCASLHPTSNRSQTSGCREYANQEAFQAEANDNERLFICPIQPRLGVGG